MNKEQTKKMLIEIQANPETTWDKCEAFYKWKLDTCKDFIMYLRDHKDSELTESQIISSWKLMAEEKLKEIE